MDGSAGWVCDVGGVGVGVGAGADAAGGCGAPDVACTLVDDWLAANEHACCTTGWMTEKNYFVLHWSKKKNFPSFTLYASASVRTAGSSWHWR